MAIETTDKGIEHNYPAGYSGNADAMNTNLRLLSQFAPDQWAFDEDATAGLAYGYKGGLAIAADGTVAAVAGSTVTIADDATSVVYRDASGAVSTDTGTDFPPGSYPMAIVTAAGGAIDANSVVDRRIFATQLPSGVALLASPALTGTPTAPTATTGTDTTQLATTAFVQQEISALGGGGDALTSDGLDQFAATTSAELAGVISDETGSGALVFANAPTLVNPVVGTQSPSDNSTKAASTAYVDAAVAAVAAVPVDVAAMFGDGVNAVANTDPPLRLWTTGDMDVTGWTISADASGSCEFKVELAAYADFPTFTEVMASERPTLSAAQKNQDTALGTTVEVRGKTCWQITPVSASTVTRVEITFNGTRV